MDAPLSLQMRYIYPQCLFSGSIEIDERTIQRFKKCRHLLGSVGLVHIFNQIPALSVGKIRFVGIHRKATVDLIER